MSKTSIQPYLFFAGRCEEALEFYKSAIDAQVSMVMRFSESPEPCQEGQLPPGFEDKVMHASFTVGESLIMASDGCGDLSPFTGFSLSIAAPSEADADRYFSALAEGGEIIMPLGKTFWSPRFGMIKDKFGMGWMINTLPADQQGCA